MSKKKNILLVTPLFPIPSSLNSATPVCLYFAKEWKELGHNVIVIHIQPEYPILSRILLKISRHIHNNHDGGGYFYDKTLRFTQSYLMEGVQIFRIPVYKLRPRYNFLKSSLFWMRKKIYNNLSKMDFSPDIIIGHMLQIDVVPYINHKFEAKTCIVSHGLNDHYKAGDKLNTIHSQIMKYDYIGYRSPAIQKQYEDNVGSHPNSFICYSGIPTMFLSAINKSFTNPLSVIYVGDLIERKHPETVIIAFASALSSGCNLGVLTIIGDGDNKCSLRRKAEEYEIANRVLFLGKMSRDEIIKHLDTSAIFAMVSEHEVFGLVYLEAMARGCIVIGSQNEGIDGIIINGQNGFLCQSGNASQLHTTIKYICSLSDEDKKQISQEAQHTANMFSDRKVAISYLNSIGL